MKKLFSYVLATVFTVNQMVMALPPGVLTHHDDDAFDGLVKDTPIQTVLEPIITTFQLPEVVKRRVADSTRKLFKEQQDRQEVSAPVKFKKSQTKLKDSDSAFLATLQPSDSIYKLQAKGNDIKLNILEVLKDCDSKKSHYQKTLANEKGQIIGLIEHCQTFTKIKILNFDYKYNIISQQKKLIIDAKDDKDDKIFKANLQCTGFSELKIFASSFKLSKESNVNGGLVTMNCHDIILEGGVVTANNFHATAANNLFCWETLKLHLKKDIYFSSKVIVLKGELSSLLGQLICKGDIDHVQFGRGCSIRAIDINLDAKKVTALAGSKIKTIKNFMLLLQKLKLVKLHLLKI